MSCPGQQFPLRVRPARNLAGRTRSASWRPGVPGVVRPEPRSRCAFQQSRDRPATTSLYARALFRTPKYRLVTTSRSTKLLAYPKTRCTAGCLAAAAGEGGRGPGGGRRRRRAHERGRGREGTGTGRGRARGCRRGGSADTGLAGVRAGSGAGTHAVSARSQARGGWRCAATVLRGLDTTTLLDAGGARRGWRAWRGPSGAGPGRGCRVGLACLACLAGSVGCRAAGGVRGGGWRAWRGPLVAGPRVAASFSNFRR